MGEPKNPSKWIEANFLEWSDRDVEKMRALEYVYRLHQATSAYLDELQRLNPELKWPE